MKEEKSRKIEEEKALILKRQIEEDERIKEENRRIKEWENKFDQDQKKKEEELIKKFYSNQSKNYDTGTNKIVSDDQVQLNEDEGEKK